MKKNKTLKICFYLIFLVNCYQIKQKGIEKADVLANKELNIKDVSYTQELNLVPKEGVLNYDGLYLDVYSYNGFIPGPTIKARYGDRIKINFKNELNEPSSIHWHGIQVENKMDGVPGLTQKEVQPNKSFVYEFELNNPGIYWYHPHFESIEQVDMGLYGALIVDDKIPIQSDKDEVLFLDDFRLAKGQISTRSNMHDIMMSGKYGNSYLLNGKKFFSLNVNQGDLLRLRLINPSNARIYNFGLDKKFLVLGHDIGLVKKPYLTDFVQISPGDRFDILVYIDRNLEIRNYSREDYEKIGEIITHSVNKNSSKNKLYFDQLQNKNLNKDLNLYFRNQKIEKDIEVSFQLGGSMHNPKWFVNGKSLNENPDIIHLQEGKLYKFKLKNLDSHAHPIHLHGQKFIVTKRTYDVPNTIDKGFEDTVLIYGNEEVEILYIAEGKGNWLEHCHILEHVDFGMGNVIRVN